MSKDILLCPACETENDALQRTCVNCGEPLIAVCPRCSTVNPITAAQCSACGQQLDTLGQIMTRHEVRYTDRFTRQADMVSDIMSAQKATDRARSQQLWAQEQQRQEYLQTQKLRQKRQERVLMIGVAVAAVILLALVLLVALAR